MATARTTLFYGVLVEASGVILAAESYNFVKRSLVAVDLICARRRKGALVVSPNALNLVSAVPEEVWDVVKQQLIDVASIEAEKKLLEAYKFPSESRWDHAVNDIAFLSDIEGYEMLFIQRRKMIEALCRDFGFAVSLHHWLGEENLPLYRSSQPHCLCAISLHRNLSSVTSRGTTSFPYCEAYAEQVEDQYDHSEEVVRFSRDAMFVPPSTDQRFKSFLDKFHLEARDSKLPVFYPVKDDEGGKEDQMNKKEREQQNMNHESICCSDARQKPHWHLWTEATCFLE